jgi:hypothetical protein
MSSDSVQGIGVIGLIKGVIVVPLKIIYVAIDLIITLITGLLTLGWLIIVNLPTILFFLCLLGVSVIWLEYHPTLIEGTEDFLRCKLKAFYEEEFKDFVDTIEYGYERIICWTNAVAHFNRLFSSTFFIKQTFSCVDNPSNVWSVLKKFVDVVVQFWLSVGIWALKAGPLSQTFPMWYPLGNLVFAVDEVVSLAICTCSDARPLLLWAKRIVTDSNLFCALHQIVNGLLSIIQKFISFGTSMFRLLYDITTGNLDGLIDWIIANGNASTHSSTLPDLTLPMERLYAGSLALGAYLDSVISIIICTLDSEIKSQGNPILASSYYATCDQSGIYRWDVFQTVTSTWGIGIVLPIMIGPIPAVLPGFRTVSVIVDLLSHIFSVFDPTSDFLVERWNIEIIWDTIRDPVFPLNDTLSSIKGDSSSANNQVYGNGILKSCGVSYPSIEYNLSTVGCLECNKIGNISIETRICGLMHRLDTTIFGNTNTSLAVFKPVICCLLGSGVRIVVAVLKTIVDALRYWKNLDAFFPHEEKWLTGILNEIGGSPTKLGGLLGCLKSIVTELDSNFRCFIGLVVYVAKFLLEMTRNIIILLPRILSTILNQPNGLESYLCIRHQTCFPIRTAVNWLITPRYFNETLAQWNSTSYKPIQFVNFTTAEEETAVECLCNLINLSFLKAYFDIKFENICCGIKSFFRASTELFVFIVELLIGILRSTFFSTTSVTNSVQNLDFLRFLACSTAGDRDLCTNIQDIVSDIQDFLGCPCLFFLDLNVLLDSGSSGFSAGWECLCTLTNGIGSFFIAILKSVQVLAQILLTAFDCILDPNNNSGACLRSNFYNQLNSFLEKIDDSLDGISETFEGIGCLLGQLIVVANQNQGCQGGAYEPECPNTDQGCTASTRLAVVVRDIINVLLIIIHTFLDIIAAALRSAVLGSSASGTTLGPVGILYNLSLGLSNALWGTVGTTPTQGLVQHLGAFVSCSLGPWDCNINDDCSGAFLLIAGNFLRDNFDLLNKIVFHLLFLLENIFLKNVDALCPFPGQPNECPGHHLTQFIISIFDFILNFILKSPTGLIDFVFTILKAIVRLIPVIGTGIAKFLEIVQTIVDFLISTVFGFFGKLACFFTSGDITCFFKKKRDVVEREWNIMKTNLNTHIKDKSKMFNSHHEKERREALEFKFDPEGLMATMDKQSYCYRALNATRKKINNKEPLDLFEEIVHNVCFGLVSFPAYYNQASADEAVNLGINASYAFGKLPLNSGYDWTVATGLLKNYATAMNYYTDWKKATPTSFDYLSQGPSWGTSVTLGIDLTTMNDLPVIDVTNSSTITEILIASTPKEEDTNTTTTFGSIKRTYSASYEDLRSRIVVGESFKDYLSHVSGLNCPYTDAFFESIEAHTNREETLSIYRIKALSIYMTDLLKKSYENNNNNNNSNITENNNTVIKKRAIRTKRVLTRPKLSVIPFLSNGFKEVRQNIEGFEKRAILTAQKAIPASTNANMIESRGWTKEYPLLMKYLSKGGVTEDLMTFMLLSAENNKIQYNLDKKRNLQQNTSITNSTIIQGCKLLETFLSKVSFLFIL